MPKIKYIITFFVLNISIVNADVGADLDNFLKENTFSNSTSPSASITQSGGFINFGSVRSSARVRQMPDLVTIDTPKVSGGCSGIDMYAGSLSFISGDQIKSMIKSTVANAGYYALMLGIQTVAPSIEKVMKDAAAIVQKANQWNLNSCEAAKKLVNGAIDLVTEKETDICIRNKVAGGKDRQAAVESCKNAVNESASDPKSLMDKNIVWDVLNEGWTAGDMFVKNNMRQVVMSITGTVVYKIKNKGTDSATIEPLYYPSLVKPSNTKSLFTALMKGSDKNDIKVYQCNPSNSSTCLNVIKVPWKGLTTVSFKSRVTKALKDMQAAVKSDICPTGSGGVSCLTAEQEAILENTSLPLYKLLNLTAVYGTNMGISIDSYAEIIAFDLTTAYIGDVFDKVIEALGRLEGEHVGRDKFLKSLRISRRDYLKYTMEQRKSFNAQLDLIQRIEFLDGKVKTALSSDLRNLLAYESNN